MTSQTVNTLIIRPGALGDAVLTLPALQRLRENGVVGLLILGTPASWGFIRQAHDGLRIRDFSSQEWLGLFAPDAQLGPAARTALQQTETAIVYLKDAASVVAALEAAGVKQVSHCEPPTQATVGDSHASDVLLAAVRDASPFEDIPDLQDDPFLALDDHERVAALDKLGLDAVPDGGFYAIHPGSGGRKKCWPAARFAKVAVELACNRGITPLVFFGPADDAVRDEFEAHVPPGVDWQPADNLPLRDVLALLSLCRGFVGNDSGMTHLAARACATLALLGPTKPAIWRPLGKSVRVLEAPRGELSALSVEAVVEQLA